MRCDESRTRPSAFDRAFAIGVALNLSFVVVEAAYGLIAHSLALLADSGHNLGRKRDLNIRGAFIHMAAVAAVSLGVVVAGIAMEKTGWMWLDPMTSLTIVAVIAVGTWGLLRESLNLALHAVPEGIVAVHDLHIWPMSTTLAYEHDRRCLDGTPRPAGARD